MNNKKTSNQVIDNTHDEDVKDILNTVEDTKELLEHGEYDKVLDNLNHIKYLCQYL